MIEKQSFDFAYSQRIQENGTTKEINHWTVIDDIQWLIKVEDSRIYLNDNEGTKR